VAKQSIFWDQPVFKATLASDTAIEILAIAADGTLKKRPAINTSTFMSSALVNGHIFVGNASNIATDVAVTGDVTITNAGVTSIGAGVIVNADINASADIARYKLAALTPSRVMVTDGSGVDDVATVTAATLAFLDATSSVQTQLNSKLTGTLTTPATGDMIRYSGGNLVNFAVGTNGQVLTVSGGVPTWSTPSAGGLPAGGSTGQYLNKIDGTDYNVQWSSLTVVKITDLTASAAELNIMDGVTASTAEINRLVGVTSGIQAQFSGKQATVTGAASTVVSSNLTADRVLVSDGAGKIAESTINALTTLTYLDATSSVQTQLDSKLAKTLSQNAIFVGNGSNIATELAAGANGYVLTSSAGTPTWAAAPSANPFPDNATLIKNNSDNTKLAIISAASISTLTTRTYTLPDANDTFVVLAATQALTNKTLGAGTKIILGSDAVGDLYYAAASNVLTRLAAGTSGYVLTSGGAGVAPAWAATTSITNSAASTEVMVSNGTNAVGTKLYSAANGDITFGDSGLAGQSRTVTTAGSDSNISIVLTPKGAGSVLAKNDANTKAIYIQSDATTIKAVNTTPGTFYVVASDGGGGGSTGGILSLRSGNGLGVGNTDAGDLEIRTGAPFGAGAEGSVKVQTRSAGKLGFFDVAPVVRQDGLTTLTHTAPGTPDYAIQDLINVAGYGFATKDEGNTVLKLIAAMQTALKNYGILT
jgi:hypothetical protein